jgi:hypothetical protein
LFNLLYFNKGNEKPQGGIQGLTEPNGLLCGPSEVTRRENFAPLFRIILLHFGSRYPCSLYPNAPFRYILFYFNPKFLEYIIILSTKRVFPDA